MRNHLQPVVCPNGCGYRCGDKGRIKSHLEGRKTPCETGNDLFVSEVDLRKAKEVVKGKTWEAVYCALFKCDESEVPSPCLLSLISIVHFIFVNEPCDIRYR